MAEQFLIDEPPTICEALPVVLNVYPEETG